MPHTVLVVEDDRHINQVVTEYLKDAGYIALSEEDGAAALDLLQREEKIDLFVLDILLPGVGGFDLLHAVRASTVHAKKPVVMLTALDDEATQVQGFEALADDYVTKPFSPRVLIRRVQALLRRAVPEMSALCCGALRLDYDRYEVYEGSGRLNLTQREFELLGTLMRNAGKVMSRQQLLNYAWGYNYFGDERIVDVHVKNLRKKLAADAIVTVKGVGYKLEEDWEHA